MNNEKENIKSLYIKASEVEPKEVRWLWYPYIPLGKLTVIQGDPRDGKFTFYEYDVKHKELLDLKICFTQREK